ncbi:sigma-54-dependent transcriptional regulator [Aliagarivorans taiwanensis]|uniref:sigma-54-dependent transcriptional regulator n=1 Tax=Aliagarivorans taiwanensis TaxID=561966 RepID=UPI0004076AB4|nr:sigma-54 dependent transcriptional regulator [Aliagarivorans taiwanensis]
MTASTILIVEDDAGLREALVDTLMLSGYSVVEADCAEQALIRLNESEVDLVISDIQMPGMDGLNLLKNIKKRWSTVPVLLMTAYAKIDDAVNAMRDGAVDYIAKPFAPEVLLNQVSRYASPSKPENYSPVYGDPSTEKLLKLAEKVAGSEASVLISGPSGTGKEVLSRFIHNNSPRKDAPFIAINCAAIPDNMLEATLFGYEKGAFTGAVKACPGKFELAQGGTILLDEITEMDINLQAKLLRVLQEKEVERLGGRTVIPLDVRVLATSNRDMRSYVDEGNFREDLYYRLNVFPLRWNALKQRPGDIIPLAEHLLVRHQPEQHYSFSPDAVQKLLSHSWPGNVRELDNVMQRALILACGELIEADDLIIEGLGDDEFPTAASIEPADIIAEQSAGAEVLGNELKFQEQQIILQTLKACNGKRKDVAERLGISPRTLRYKLARIRESGVELPA